MRTPLHSPADPARLAREISRLRARRTFLRSAPAILAALTFAARPARAAVTEAWVHRYNGPANEHDEARAVAMDASGNVVVTGSSHNGPSNFDNDYYTAKYAAANGALLWEKRYNGLGNSDDQAQAVALDGSGNVVVTGSSYFPYSDGVGAHSDYYTAKYAAANGTLLWEQRYNHPWNYDGRARAVAVDVSGNVVVAGSTGTNNGFGCYLDFYTAKYAAADGALLWEKQGPPTGCTNYGVAGDVAVAIDGRGNVVVTGAATLKYAAADGALLWEKYSGGNGKAVAVDGSGNVLVTGFTADSTGQFSDYYTAKYAAADGALLWEKRGPGGFAAAVAVDDSGNVVVTGSSYGTHYDYYTAKYASADGALLWERRYNGPGNVYDEARAVAVDDSGNVVVTGYSYSGTNSYDDYYTAKYAAADGTLLWEKRYNGLGNTYDAASSLALGPNGMVAITGSSDGNFNSDTLYDYATVVYRDIPPVSFAAWAACSGLSGAAAAADADPDSDGLPNSAEYILGGNPMVPGTSGSPTATASGDNIVLTFPRDDESETADVTLTVEAGTNLLTWPAVFHIGPNTAASSPGVSINENGAAPDTITVTIPQGKAPRLFARLKVTIIP